MQLVGALPHGASVRVKTCDLTGRVAAYTLKTDNYYWRGYEVKCKPGSGGAFDEWQLRSLAPEASPATAAPPAAC